MTHVKHPMNDQVESLEYAQTHSQELITKKEAEVAALLHELASHRADIKERDDLASGLVTSLYPAIHSNMFHIIPQVASSFLVLIPSFDVCKLPPPI